MKNNWIAVLFIILCMDVAAKSTLEEIKQIEGVEKGRVIAIADNGNFIVSRSAKYKVILFEIDKNGDKVKKIKH